MVSVMKCLVLLVCVLLSVAFITYFERKFLGYIQIRKGPNKVGFKGLFQPFSDAEKLFVNEIMFFNFSKYLLFVISPGVALGLMLLIWLSYSSVLGVNEMNLGVIYILCCLSMGVYPIIGAGWFSSSKYSFLGGFRAIAQTISYEVSMVVIMLGFIVVMNSYNLLDYMNKGVIMILISPVLSMTWYISMLAELNRTPFDLTEGESELVSGFNTEYGGGFFALFFLAEYGMILFLSFLFVTVFLMGSDESGVVFLEIIFVVMSVIWVRGVLPRIRYDKLMMMAWKVFLPISLFYLMFFVVVNAVVFLTVVLRGSIYKL